MGQEYSLGFRNNLYATLLGHFTPYILFSNFLMEKIFQTSITSPLVSTGFFGSSFCTNLRPKNENETSSHEKLLIQIYFRIFQQLLKVVIFSLCVKCVRNGNKSFIFLIINEKTKTESHNFQRARLWCVINIQITTLKSIQVRYLTLGNRAVTVQVVQLQKTF